MAVTDRISGKDVYVSFNGTVLDADFTSVSVSEEADQVDVTAADEASHYYVGVRKDGTVDMELFYNAGTAQTEFDAVAVNAAGTLIVGPRGTASTYPKLTWTRAIVKTRGLEMPFDAEVKLTVNFQLSSALTRGSW
jgi:hypothetical protein